MLVGKGASMDLQEWNGTTALMYASKSKYGKVVEVALGTCASTDVQNGWHQLSCVH